jgi:TetR/AcrR family transcriptional repressor of nem operon
MSSTKQEILTTAEGLIRTKGYNAFSYADISKVLNVKNAAIHYHYPTKGDLGCAVIQQTEVEFLQRINAWKSQPPTRKLENFIGIYERSQQQHYVCFMGALSASYDTLPTTMQTQLTHTSLTIRNWVVDFMKEGKRTSEFTFSCSSEEMTDLVISTLMSSLMLNKVSHLDTLASVKKSIYDSLEIKKSINDLKQKEL